MAYFSIIMPAYNVGKYISMCLDSILKQTFCDYEINIVDDESSDDTLRIALNYAEKHKCIRVESMKHARVGAVRNKAISSAQGKYLVFVDADDVLEPEMLERLHGTLMSHEADICYLPTHYVLLDIGKTKHELIKGLQEDSYYFPSRDDFFSFVRQNKGTVPGSMWTQACKREVILEHDIEFMEEYVWSQDSDYCFQVLSAAKDVSVCSYAGYCWNRLNLTSTTQKVTEAKVLSRLAVYKKWYDKVDEDCFGKINSLNADYLKKSFLRNYYEVLQSYSFLKNKKERESVKHRIDTDALLSVEPELLPKHFKKHNLDTGRLIYLFDYYFNAIKNKAKKLRKAHE